MTHIMSSIKKHCNGAPLLVMKDFIPYNTAVVFFQKKSTQKFVIIKRPRADLDIKIDVWRDF